MSIDLEFDGEQQVLADAAARVVAGLRPAGTLVFDDAFAPAVWPGLAALGTWRLGDEAATAGHLVAVCETLGRLGVAGPIAATLLARACLPADLGEQLAGGSALVSLGDGRLHPWGMRADIFIGMVDARLWLLAPGTRTAQESLSGEPWARVDTTPVRELGTLAQHRAVYDLALAAWLCGAGQGLIAQAAEHAQQRRQFGKTLGEFQAVAFPLADAAVELDAATTLCRVAALRRASAQACANEAALAARLVASRAARRAAQIAHQTLGALGMLRAGPVYWLSRRIVEAGLQPPDDDDGLAALDPTAVRRVLALESTAD